MKRKKAARSGSKLLCFKKPTLVALGLVIVMILFYSPAGYALGPTPGQELKAMGLIEGRSGGDLAENSYLTRTEMMVILARMLGEYDQAVSWSWPSGFADHNNHWGEAYVAYAQNRGWTVGIGNNQFGYEYRTTVQESSVFMLKSLGYTAPQDFIWETAYDKARSLGLFEGLSLNQNQNILRGSLFKVMLNTLETNSKGDSYSLGESLGVLVGPKIASQVAIDRMDTPLAAVRIGDKWGYMDSDGRLAIRFNYDQAYDFSENIAAVALNGKFGYIDKAGTLVIDPRYEDAGNFAEGLAAVKTNGKYGFVNKRGSWVIEPKYDYADLFSEGLARVVISGKVGFIDDQGNLEIQAKYEEANNFFNGVAAVKENGLIGYLNASGTQIISPKYLISGNAVDGLIRFNTSDSVGFMNISGTVMIPARYLWADNFSESLAVVETKAPDGTYNFFYINTKGDKAFSLSYQDAYGFSEGLAFVMTGGKYGIINKRGTMVVQPRFSTVDDTGFSNGLARITTGNLVGFVDTGGTTVIAPQFDEARRFSN